MVKLYFLKFFPLDLNFNRSQNNNNLQHNIAKKIITQGIDWITNVYVSVSVLVWAS